MIFDKIILKSRKLSNAYELAKKVHKNQKRKSGEPYVSHCIEVFKIIYFDWGIKDEDFGVAALIHDVAEDSEVSLDQICKDFGEKVAELVEGVTNIKMGSDKEILTKVLSKTYINPGVAIIKLADRLHNMRTLQYMPKVKQQEKAQETLDVYARLAESLGMWTVKTELEDLCFKYLEPENFMETKSQIDNDLRLEPLFLNNIKSGLSQLLIEFKLNGNVEVYREGYWALREKQKKLSMMGKSDPDSFVDINDLVGFKVILDSISDCYQFLGIIHKKYGETVDFERLDVFVDANSRLNGYQAIQVTLDFPIGSVEIALVTDEMEEFNREGVLSLIKKGKNNLSKYSLKMVFTPTNSIRFLPKNATAFDFAAAINQRMLADAKIAIINNEEKPLSTVIPNAATVEIIVDEPRLAPIVGAENYCLPETAKIINDQRKREKRKKRNEDGKVILESILAPRGLLVLTDLGDLITRILYHFGCQKIDDLYFMIGGRSINLKELELEFDKAKLTKKDLGLTTIRLKGKDRPGILIDVIGMIYKFKKSIVLINQQNQNGCFDLRILVKGLDKKREIKLKDQLISDPRFESQVV